MFQSLSSNKKVQTVAAKIRSVENWYNLLPDSRFLLCWDVWIFVNLLITGVAEPYMEVFMTDAWQTKFVNVYLAFVFMLDTCLNFFRAFRDSTRDGVVLVTDPSRIARHYLRTRFWADALSSLPLALISPRLAIFQLLRILRLHRMMWHLAQAGVSFSALNLVEFCLMSGFVLHWLACVWATIGLDEDGSWMLVAQEKLGFFEADNCVDKYLLSLYWAVTVLSSVGFGDITPGTRAEFLCAIVCMGIGGCVWAYIVGSVCGMVSALDKYRIDVERKGNDLMWLCRETKLPRQLAERIKGYFSHAKEFLKMEQYHEVMKELSPALKGEVVAFLYGRCLKRVWYFDVCDTRCQQVLVEGMIPKMYGAGEHVENITGRGDRALVFLRSGLCSRKNALLAPGAVWGTDVILDTEEHEDIEELLDEELAVTINFCFVLLLGKNSIDHAASMFPVFGKRLRKAHTRMLLWRGIIAVSRAVKKLEEKERVPEKISRWDQLGMNLAKVVHKDCELLHSNLAQTPMPTPISCLSKTGGRRSANMCITRKNSLCFEPASPASAAFAASTAAESNLFCLEPAVAEPAPRSSDSKESGGSDAPAAAGSPRRFGPGRGLPDVHERLDLQAEQLDRLGEEVGALSKLVRKLLTRLDANERF